MPAANPSHHPDAAQLRLFALNRLKPAAAGKVEEHTDVCNTCAVALERIQAEHSAIRADLRLRGLSAHVTAAGPVSVWVVQNKSRWLVRVIGPQVHLGETAGDKATAIKKAMAAFAGRFPDHACDACIGTQAGRDSSMAS